MFVVNDVLSYFLNGMKMKNYFILFYLFIFLLFSNFCVSFSFNSSSFNSISNYNNQINLKNENEENKNDFIICQNNTLYRDILNLSMIPGNV